MKNRQKTRTSPRNARVSPIHSPAENSQNRLLNQWDERLRFVGIEAVNLNRLGHRCHEQSGAQVLICPDQATTQRRQDADPSVGAIVIRRGCAPSKLARWGHWV